MTQQTLSVGTPVWFYPYGHDPGAANPPHRQRCPGVVSRVWTDTCVNLEITLPSGAKEYPTSVLVWRLGIDKPTGYFCELQEPQEAGERKDPVTVAYEASQGGEWKGLQLGDPPSENSGSRD